MQRCLISLILFIGLVPASIVHAALVHISLSGDINFIERPLSFVDISSTFSVNYTVDSSNPIDTLTDLDYIARYFSVLDLIININDEVWLGDSTAYIQLSDVLPTNPFYPEETYSVVDFGVGGHTTLSNLSVFTVFSGSMFTDEFNGIDLQAIPPFSPSDYKFKVLYGSLDEKVQIDGQVRDISFSVVHEPPTFTLFLILTLYLGYQILRTPAKNLEDNAG